MKVSLDDDGSSSRVSAAANHAVKMSTDHIVHRQLLWTDDPLAAFFLCLHKELDQPSVHNITATL